MILKTFIFLLFCSVAFSGPIPYFPPGGGAAQTITNPLNGWYNVNLPGPAGALTAVGNGIAYDNLALQQDWNYCNTNRLNMLLPSPSYAVSQTINIINVTGTAWNGFVWGTIKGSTLTPGQGGGTILIPNFKDNPVWVVQGSRGLQFENIFCQGPNSNSFASSSYYQNNAVSFVGAGQRDSPNSPESGWTLDPISNPAPADGGYPTAPVSNLYAYTGSVPWSSTTKWVNCGGGGFTVLICLSPNGNNEEGDCDIIDNLQTFYGMTKVLVSSGSNQADSIVIDKGDLGAASWTLFDNTDYGGNSGGKININGVECGGDKYVAHVLNNNDGNVFSVTNSNIYTYSLGQYGGLPGGTPLLFLADFIQLTEAGGPVVDLGLYDTIPTEFDSCVISTIGQYPWRIQPKFAGQIKFVNTSFNTGQGNLMQASAFCDTNMQFNNLFADFSFDSSWQNAGSPVNNWFRFSDESRAVSLTQANQAQFIAGQRLITGKDGNEFTDNLDGTYQLATVPVSIYQDGSGDAAATYTSAAASIIEPGDIIVSSNSVSYQTSTEGTYANNQTVIGTVFNVNTSTGVVKMNGVQLSLLNQAVTTGNIVFNLLASEAVTGTLTSGSSIITGCAAYNGHSLSSVFTAGERIETNYGTPFTNTWPVISGVSTTAITLSGGVTANATGPAEIFSARMVPPYPENFPGGQYATFPVTVAGTFPVSFTCPMCNVTGNSGNPVTEYAYCEPVSYIGTITNIPSAVIFNGGVSLLGGAATDSSIYNVVVRAK